MSESLLEIKNLNVVYRSGKTIVHAINGIDLVLEKGSTLGLVGETGAGKTTTALSVLGLLPERTGQIKSGEILLEGQDLLALNEKEMQQIRGEKVSMIFQDPMTALNPVIPIGKQIAEALNLHNHKGLSKLEIEARVDEVLEMVGIPAKRKEEYPHQFSGGMRQRVVIAIALACEPQLLIADEPTTALDVTIQAQVLLMMKRLKQQRDMSMIMITHDLGVVAQTCDYVAVMYAGQIVEYGTLEDIFVEKIHHPYTDGLFGSIPDLQTDSKRLKPIPGLMPDPTIETAGCRFQERCPLANESCGKQAPETVRISQTHQILCPHVCRGKN